MRLSLFLIFLSLSYSSDINPVSGDKLGLLNGRYIRENSVNFVLKTSGIDKKFNQLNDEEKEAIFYQYVDRELVKEELYKKLSQNSDFLNQIYYLNREFALEYFKRDFFKNLKIEEKDIKSFYDNNIETFIIPKKYHIRHILLDDEKIANDIYTKLKFANKDEIEKIFKILASEYSLDKDTRKNGGDIGLFDLESFDTKYRDLLKNSKLKDFIKINNNSSIDILLISDIQEEKKLTLQEVNDKIIDILKELKYKEYYESLVNELNNNKNLEIYYKNN